MPIRSGAKKNYGNSIKINYTVKFNLFLRQNIRHFEAVPQIKIWINKLLDINNNCLSSIEPDHGSEGNEHLHKLLNRSMLRGATIISYELAEAVPTVLFHNHNESKKEVKQKCSSSIKIVKQMINYQDFNLYSNETPIDFRLNIPSVSDLENVNQQNVALEFIYQNATHIFKGAEVIGKLYCRKGVSIIDHIMNKLQYTFGGNEKNLDCKKTITVSGLGRNLSHLNKEIDNIFLVEDSFFHAFAQQWGKYYSDMDETVKAVIQKQVCTRFTKNNVFTRRWNYSCRTGKKSNTRRVMGNRSYDLLIICCR